MGLHLILGGARSGKSRYAEQLATELAGETGEVLYVATAQAFDAEMTARIVRHQADRPASWRTLEVPLDLGTALAGERETAVVLIDCLTLLANNVLLRLPEEVPVAEAEAALLVEVDGVLGALGTAVGDWIIVSNEVGLGIVPATPLGRTYRDALGRANQRLAAAADSVVFMIAGLPMTVR